MKPLYLLSFLIVFLVSCSEKNDTIEKKTDNLFYDKAYELRDQHKTDSALIYFNKAKDLFQLNKDSLGIGKCLVNMGIISTDRGDYFSGQEFSLDAFSFFDKNKKENFRFLESNSNNLGIASSNLKNYIQAIDFYKQSLAYNQDSARVLVIKNNIANAYREQKEYKKALTIYENILNQKINNKRDYARTLTNLSVAKWLQNPDYNAAPGLLKALDIRERENDLLGQNSSYSHLANYYQYTDPDSALFFALKRYPAAIKVNSPDDQLDALGKLIKLSPPKEMKRYFEVYQNLDDSVQTARNAAKNQSALIRYESEKNKADNLELQKDNTEKKFQIAKQRILIFSVLLFVVAAAVIAVIWYRKRKQRMELESQNAIREHQLKTSKRVHDVVANGLYRVMTEIENRDDIDKGQVLDKIEDLYEKSRDISYEKPELDDQNFHQKISALLMSFATENAKVLIAGNTLALWKKVNPEVKYEVEHILQELMVNMKKHSGASNVAVRFEDGADQIKIYYTDNGVGMSDKASFKNGLRNTGNRIDAIHGEITFDIKVEKGLKIQICFPLS
ncbi:Tetratricopeptide repeat-containing protein [Pedobacter steynii]|uniref:histidine kinase n=2 Tax=Pedobacter steynii TaxID=430522 RepID=A0A1G9VWE8_9SPHI|nr:tetratricopeptide repeat-containing sensor histidine kinase [Pedobacter steynii]SDM76652.1 Tetratricopeptide repeat-containing protein [Pedobacter steynii]